MQKLTSREVNFCHLGESTEESLGREETALTTVLSGAIQYPGDDQLEQAVIDAGQGLHLRYAEFRRLRLLHAEARAARNCSHTHRRNTEVQSAENPNGLLVLRLKQPRRDDETKARTGTPVPQRQKPLQDQLAVQGRWEKLMVLVFFSTQRQAGSARLLICAATTTPDTSATLLRGAAEPKILCDLISP